MTDFSKFIGLIGFFTTFAVSTEFSHETIHRNVKQVETVLKYIKEQLYSGSLQPGERLPARRLAEMLGVGRAHVRTAFQKLEFLRHRPDLFPRAARSWRRRRCRCWSV